VRGRHGVVVSLLYTTLNGVVVGGREEEKEEDGQPGGHGVCVCVCVC
jgi:hypothetical protein